MSQQCSPAPLPSSKYKGNTIILLIIIVLFVVGAIFFLNAGTKTPEGPVEQYPWTETDCIVGGPTAVNLPQSPQISLDAEKIIKQRIVSDDGQNRGRLEIVIQPDGFVVAAWQANYKEDVYEKDFTATCKGNVDASQLYEDENGTDPSKLFFITEGCFIVQAFKHGNAAVNGGEAYVVGWISPDGSANGTLVLTADRKTTKIYTWGD